MKAKKIYEALGDVLKPKSEKEIRLATLDLMSSAGYPLKDAMEHDEKNADTANKLAKYLDSNVDDIMLIAEDDDHYERIENTLRMLIRKGGKSNYTIYDDRDFTYAVDKKNKIIFASSNDMSMGMNAIFFNKPFIIDLLKKYYG